MSSALKLWSKLLSAGPLILAACVSDGDFRRVSAGHSKHDAGAVDGGADSSLLADTLADSAVADSTAGDSAADAGLSNEAGAVGGLLDGAASDATTFSCAKLSVAPTFCDDFETGSIPDAWSGEVLLPNSGGTHLTIDALSARSGQRSLLASTDEGLSKTSDPRAFVYNMYNQFEGRPIEAVVELDVRIEQLDPTPLRRAMLFQWRFGLEGQGYNQLNLEIISRGSSVLARFNETDFSKPDANTMQVTSAEKDYDSFPAFNTNEWAHVRFELHAVDPSGSGNSAKLTVGDAVLFDGPLSYPLRTLSPGFELGIPQVDTRLFADQDTTHAWRVRYDNVLVSITPM